MNYYQEPLLKVKELIIYLRKSREDLEYEKKTNNYDTLQRHKLRLLSYALDFGFKEEQIIFFEEVVSGDSIVDRPEFQKVLALIEKPDHAVLVIDVQRLTRGGYSDQGKIIDTFKYTNTLIITPDKIFDLTSKADEEYFADKLNFSRKEYDHIKRRLYEGRIDSVKEGKFVASICAYGYERYKLPNEKGYSLRILEDQAEVVRLIFKMCLEGTGTHATAGYLNSLGIKTLKGSIWRKNGIREILKNKTYCGYVKWQERKLLKVVEDGILKNKLIRSKKDDYLLVKGRHEPIINETDFERAQQILKNSSEKYVKEDKELLNPLAGILRCAKCDLVMARRVPNGTYRRKDGKIYTYPVNPIVSCSNKKSCGTVTHALHEIEDELLKELKIWLKENKKIVKDYKRNSDSLINMVVNNIEIIDRKIEKENNKLDRIMSFLEDGTYTKEIFIQRSTPIKNNLALLKSNKKDITEKNEHIKVEKIKTLIPKIEECLNIYPKLNVKQKNKMLHLVLEKAVYSKTKSRKESDLKLVIYPKL